MTQLNPTICLKCIHLRSLYPAACRAYPTGIPRKFISGEQEHREPEPDDGGFRFEARRPV